MAYIIWKIFTKKCSRISFDAPPPSPPLPPSTRSLPSLPLPHRRRYPLMVLDSIKPPPLEDKSKRFDQVVVHDTKIDTAQYAVGADDDVDGSATFTVTTPLADEDTAADGSSREYVLHQNRLNTSLAAYDTGQQTRSCSRSAFSDVESNSLLLIQMIPAPSMDAPENVRRTKSRVRSYLKKCKNRLTGHQPQGGEQFNCTVTDGLCPYVPFNSAAVEVHAVNGDGENIQLSGVQVRSLSAAPEDSSAIDGNQSKQLSSVLPNVSALDSGLAELLDRYLSDIYPVYHKKTRQILIREARDLFVCTYHGCLRMFEESFLRIFTEIAKELSRKHFVGESVAWCKGWPLATHAGELILHLGALDESVLGLYEVYLCVKPDENRSPQLCAVWRSSSSSVHSHVIDYQKLVHLSALSLEMLTEELPQLLQNLIVGVEHAIGRLSLNDLTFPQATYHESDPTTKNTANRRKPSTQINSPKCALKRSELITKNKMLNDKYLLRRLSNQQEDSMKSSLSDSSVSSDGSNSCNEFNANGNNNNHPTVESVTLGLPLFCLGNSFPHIDSDEENADDKANSSAEDENVLANDVVIPRSINDVPEKLLLSGIYLPGTQDLKRRPIITVDADLVISSGLNCYEIATVLLYYSTIVESNWDLEVQKVQQNNQEFTILIGIERSDQLGVIDLICNSLNLLTTYVQCSEILAICFDQTLLLRQQQNASTERTTSKVTCTGITAKTANSYLECDVMRLQQHRHQLIKFISVDEVTASVAKSQLPSGKCKGLHRHDQKKWLEVFTLIDQFLAQCLTVGQRLVTAIGDIRSSDLQGLPSRRQLYAQHRALSRALMDSELNNMRKRGSQTLARLQDLAANLNSHELNQKLNHSNSENSSDNNNKNKMNSNNNSNYSRNETRNSFIVSCTKSVMMSTSATALATDSNSTTQYHNNNNNNNNRSNIHVAIRLNKVATLYNEVDRAAKRLEQLTEQRRERLRELTRQRALEDEINEVTKWISSDGNEILHRFSVIQLDCEAAIKEHEQEFEKNYFISIKQLAKGRDLHGAANEMETFPENTTKLKSALDTFAEKLEHTRERIEGAARLHRLLNTHLCEEVRAEAQQLAEKIGLPILLEKLQNDATSKDTSVAREIPTNCELRTEKTIMKQNLSVKKNVQLNRTPAVNATETERMKSSFQSEAEEMPLCQCCREANSNGGELEDANEEEMDDEEEEEQSKIADSGLGVCDRCETNSKLSRICSCQSLNEAGNLCDKSHNSDEIDDDCFDTTTKRFLDMHSPMEANSHLHCHASSFDLPTLEELSCLDPKTQKTLLLIMREMIGTERDYVRSLYYVIDNYVDELLRDDIPQPLRGQRNVIFGNIEKIFEFHQHRFLAELERYECSPLKVGAAFLEMESKFYLYALYNKNKPKSDTLMSEYGTQFFKSKQMELNDKMDLASYLLKPVQRMGKYALLLQQLVKACGSVEGSALQEIGADVEELERAEEMVKFQLRHGNDLLAMDSLRDCDVNVKEQGRLLRQNEFLIWQGRGGKKSLRQIFLFEELVLFSKARRFPDNKNLDIYIYKNSMKTSDIGLTAHVGDSPTKFEIWFRKRKPDDTWTVQCMSEDIKNVWTEEISRLLWKQAKRNREIRLAEMSSMGIGSKPCLDIRPSNNQISDRSITIGQMGKAPKLRQSFVGLLPENGKVSRRPNSLISESSLTSGTSSSSISTGDSSSSGGKSFSTSFGNSIGLELIKETQTLTLTGVASEMKSTSGGIVENRNRKRSTTLVSQLSLESGIVPDVSTTPDNETHEVTWRLTHKAPATAYSNTRTSTSASSTSASTSSNECTHQRKSDSFEQNKANFSDNHEVDHCNRIITRDPYIQDNSMDVHLKCYETE